MKPYKTAALTAVWRHMSCVDEHALEFISFPDKIIGHTLGYLDKNSVETIKQRTIIIDSVIKKLSPECVVEIGAGFSSRPKRFQGVKFYEMDLPYFKTRKNNMLLFDIERDKLGLKIKNGLFIVEGVTMYLHEDKVINLLRQIKKYKGHILIDFFNEEYSTKSKTLKEKLFKMIFKAFIGRSYLFDFRIKNANQGKVILKKLGYKQIRHYKYNIPKTLDSLFYAEL